MNVHARLLCNRKSTHAQLHLMHWTRNCIDAKNAKAMRSNEMDRNIKWCRSRPWYSVSETYEKKDAIEFEKDNVKKAPYDLSPVNLIRRQLRQKRKIKSDWNNKTQQYYNMIAALPAKHQLNIWCKYFESKISRK